MTFRTEVQKSTEVGFAMDVFYALNSNNFVRFFRLLRYLFISAWSLWTGQCLLYWDNLGIFFLSWQTVFPSSSLRNSAYLSACLLHRYFPQVGVLCFVSYLSGVYLLSNKWRRVELPPLREAEVSIVSRGEQGWRSGDSKSTPTYRFGPRAG